MTVIETILAEWKPGDTYATLAARLGMEPRKVSNYYAKYPKVHATHPITSATRVNGETRQYAARKARLAALAEARIDDTDDGERGNYTLLTLPAGGCHFPFGTRNFTYCGEPRDYSSKGEYCAHHARLVYQQRERAA